jgi:hypothetical protein
VRRSTFVFHNTCVHLSHITPITFKFHFLRYEEAVSAYEEALVLEPDNKGTKASIAQAKGKIAELEKKSALASSSGERVCSAMSAMCGF